ncbi:MAG TPA: efflux RND transporter permease subunit, partial [bacterium]|nr:efflux RND transporter permease subunit [bacterium]
MFLSDASVKRPVAMSCLFIALTILGTNAWRKMSLELMPSFSIPFITIVTIYPGASPEEIEVDVAKRIEDAVGKISGLKNITSTCMSNVHQALLEFAMGKNVDIVATEVSRQLDTILPDLPVNAEKPQVQTFDVNSTAVVTFALTGDVPLDELYDYADNEMSDRLTVIPGVAKVELTGGAEREVHILLDRDAVAARGLTSMDIVRTVQNGLGKTPAGNIRGGGVEYTVKYDADFRAVEELGSLEIVNDAGRRCYLRDVATVSMSTEELRKTARLDGRQAVAVKVYKREDANAVRVVDQVRVVLDKMRQTMPGGMELVWVTDDATFIRASNSSAWVNVAQGIVLTAAVLFFFLYDLRALLVVSISMPLTVVIGLFFIQAAGFSLNMATLIAIGMSVGILVTNSIVVMEAIFKCLHDNHSPREASIIGASDSFIPVLASAGTNLVVLFPLAMMKSKVAEFIRPLALTMLIMTLVSLFISFTLTPMLCSLLLR